MAGKFTRRHLLKIGAAALGGVLVGCTPEVVKETVIVRETVEVEKEVEKVVEKEVTKVVEKEVEKVVEKVVTATPAVKDVTIRFMIWGGDAEKKAWAAREAVLREKHPYIRVATTFPPGNYQEKLTAMLASGTAPDVIVASTLNVQAPSGILLPLDSYVEADTDFDVADVMPGMFDRGKYQGVQYAIPGGLGPQCIYWNVDFFEEAGLENPNDLYEKGQWTKEKFLEYAQALTVKEGDRYTRFGWMFYGAEVINLAIQFGAPHFEHPNYTKATIDDRHVALYQWVADLGLVHHVGPLASEQGEFGTWAGFRDGKYGMFISGPWNQGRLVESKFHWDVTQPFLEPDGKVAMQAGLGGMGVYSLSKYPYEAYLWCANTESKEGQSIWAGLGFDIPNRKSLVPKYESGELFTDPRAKPDSVNVWYAAANNSLPQFNGWTPAETTALFGTAWGLVRSGEKTAAEVYNDQLETDVNATVVNNR